MLMKRIFLFSVIFACMHMCVYSQSNNRVPTYRVPSSAELEYKIRKKIAEQERLYGRKQQKEAEKQQKTQESQKKYQESVTQLKQVDASQFMSEPPSEVTSGEREAWRATTQEQQQHAQERAEMMKGNKDATKKGYVSPEKNILGQNTKSDNPVKLIAKDFSKERKSMPRGCVLPQNGTGHPNYGSQPSSGQMVPRRPMSADKIRQNYSNRNQANINANQFPSTFDLIPTPSNGLKDNTPQRSHIICVLPKNPSVEPNVISTSDLVKPYNSKPTNVNNKQGGPYSSDFNAIDLRKLRNGKDPFVNTPTKIEEMPPGQIDQGYFKKPDGMEISNVGNNVMNISSKGKANASYKTGRPDGLVQGGRDTAPDSEWYKRWRAINQPFRDGANPLQTDKNGNWVYQDVYVY